MDKASTSAVTCPVCGEGSLTVRSSLQAMTHQGKSADVPYLYAQCDVCGSEVADDRLVSNNKRTALAFRRDAEGLLSGEAIRSLRCRLGITQEIAAQLFGGGKVGFSRYENDDVSQSTAMDTLLRLCISTPAVVFEIARIRDVVLSLETVQMVGRQCLDELAAIAPRVQAVLDARQAEKRSTLSSHCANEGDFGRVHKTHDNGVTSPWRSVA